MKATLSLIPVLAVAAMAMTPSKAAARGENELVRLAHSIEDIASELKEEFSVHYRHSSAYRHLMSDVSQILSEAAHIDRLAHDPHSSLHHIKADLEDLDDLAHHLHEVVDAVERGRYRGHVDGNTRHVHSMLDSLNNTIHRMERTVIAYSAPPSGCDVGRGRDDHRGHDNHRGHDDRRSTRGQIAGAIIGALLERNSHRGHRH